MPSTIFVTGATGQTGGNVCEQLIQRGDQVRALVRNPDEASALSCCLLGVHRDERIPVRQPRPAEEDGATHDWRDRGAHAGRRFPPGDAGPAPCRLEGRRHEEEHAERSGQPGQQAGHGRPLPVPGTEGEKGRDRQGDRRGLGVAHHQHEGRRHERDQPGGPTSQGSVACRDSRLRYPSRRVRFVSRV